MKHGAASLQLASQDNFLTFVLQMNISTGTVSKKSRFTERVPASSLVFSVTDV